MKTRHGFVSNSSSTSFTFCYKGEGIKPLTDLILTKYREQFNRSYDEWSCRAQDVVEAIENCFRSDHDWHKVSPVSIDNILENYNAGLKEIMTYVEEAKDKPSSIWPGQGNYFLEKKQETEDKIKKMKAVKKRGLTTVLVIGFGDNHGEVSGGNLGHAMDYDGRNIDINAKDLVVFTE
jgi:hypothetical protein